MALQSTNQSTIYMLDAFDGNREIFFKGHTSNSFDIHATFTPDAKCETTPPHSTPLCCADPALGATTAPHVFGAA